MTKVRNVVKHVRFVVLVISKTQGFKMFCYLNNNKNCELAYFL